MEGKKPKKKYDYKGFAQFHINNVPRQLKETVTRDRKQKGIPENSLLKNIIADHYQRFPLVLNPHFAED